MAQNTYKSNTFRKPEKEKKGKSSSKFKITFYKDPRLKLALGFFLMIVGLYLFLAMLSYLFTWRADESVVQAVRETTLWESGHEVENWLGLYGAVISQYMIFRWFGIAAFFIPPVLFFVGFKIVFDRELLRLFSFTVFSVFSGLWLSLLLGYMTMISEGTRNGAFWAVVWVESAI